MSRKIRIFVSSVQKELAEERKAVKSYVEGDPLLGRFFEVFLFEDLPASDRRADNVYLEEVDRCDIYLGIYGQEYGYAFPGQPSPTEQEYIRATEKAKHRIILVKGTNDVVRESRMTDLIRQASSQLIRRRFQSVSDLTGELYASLVDYLEKSGKLSTLPFDVARCSNATLDDISGERVSWFLQTAKQERQFALKPTASVQEALTHLNLLDDQHPSHAAVLLFGSNPQRFMPTAETKCMHFHGTEVRKPIPSYQIFKGTVFQQVDEAVDFVLSKTARSVAARKGGPETEVDYEIPKAAINEAIVNAIAHRDYTSNASVQVMLFADRLEIWNPGELPSSLTLDGLRTQHPSIPRNPLLADPLFLAHYIEKAGTGTLDMIAACRDAGLPEPEYEQRSGQFVTTIWRDWLTETVLMDMGLNERQVTVLGKLKYTDHITKADYQRIADVAPRTALRDLNDLVSRGILSTLGAGRGVHYIRSRKRAINAPKSK